MMRSNHGKDEKKNSNFRILDVKLAELQSEPVGIFDGNCCKLAPFVSHRSRKRLLAQPMLKKHSLFKRRLVSCGDMFPLYSQQERDSMRSLTVAVRHCLTTPVH